MNLLIIFLLIQGQFGPSMTEKFRKNWITVRKVNITKKSGTLTPAWTGEENVKPIIINGKVIKPAKSVIEVPSGVDVLKNLRMIKYGNLKGSTYSVTKDLEGVKCLNTLKSLGVAYKLGPNKRGIKNPVTLQSRLLNGVYYRWMWGDNADLFMECHFAVALYLAAPIFLKYGYDEILHTSVYRYTYVARSRRLSRHAAGDAIDIYALRGKNGRVMVVEKHWVRVYGDAKNCVGTVGNSEGINARKLICELETLPVFRRILTPDSDHDHRNHFHVSGPMPGETWRRYRYAGRSHFNKLSSYHRNLKQTRQLPKRYGWLDGKKSSDTGKKNVKSPSVKPSEVPDEVQTD